ncbi:MAG: ABC transporter permease [Actinomycetota bacterium]|nr:ABC transporter permease [Actinomycetota bacterium]
MTTASAAPVAGRRPERLPAGAASWARIRAVARRHAIVLKRSPHRTFDVSVWPIVDTLLFGSVGVYFARQAEPEASQVVLGYMLAGIVLWHVVYQAQIGLATGFLEETWSRNLLSMMVTPLKEWEYVAGVALFGMVKLVIGVGGVALIAAGVYAFDITDIGWGLVPVAAVLIAVGWIVALGVIGLVLRYGSGAEALVWGILFVLMPLSGVFYPVDALPRFLQPIAHALPTTHAFAVARDLVAGRPMPWGEMVLAVALTGVSAVLALAFLGWSMRVFRARGYVTRYS